jgi:cation-transporting ATPase E
VANIDPVDERGLTAAQVAERMRRGLVNRVRRSDWAAYRDIVTRNLFTVFNALVVPAAVALFVLQEYRGAVAVSGMAVINTAIGLIQEFRAKRHLDRLTLLAEAQARVVRDGQTQDIPSGDVVQGDRVLLSAGEPVVADGTVLEAHFLEVDEALLTGESDPVPRSVGQRLLSGSYGVAGDGAYRADHVGIEAFAHQTSAQARAYSYTASPLQQSIDLLIKILTYTAVALCALYVGMYWLNGYTAGEMLRDRDLIKMIAATVTSMVPQGLVLMTTISFTLGAVRMGARGAIVQRLSAVETMAAVDVLCMDKTGTLTTNRLCLYQVRVLGNDLPEVAVRDRLSLFAWLSVDQKNKSLQALRDGLGPLPASRGAELVDQLPFKSQNRFSAVRVREGQAERVLVLGACEALKPFLVDPRACHWEACWKELLGTGLRLLMFAEAAQSTPFQGTLEGFTLTPLALVSLSDELRPEAGGVLQALARQNIRFKIISGDNPETVRATVRPLQLAATDGPVVTGDELAHAPDPVELIRGRSVFGRIAPQQKLQIVSALQADHHHVGMIGDGVNDVLPIKRADLGIAMGEGSAVTKTVSGIVLQNNDFGLLPETLAEGRTIVRNLRRAGKLFLLKNVYALILIIGALGVFGLPFPYEPQQVTLLNLLTIGLPALLITFSREHSAAASRPGFLAEVGWFALRTGLVIGAAGLTVQVLSGRLRGDDVATQRTLVLSTLILLGATALWRSLTDGEPAPLHGDRWLRLLALLALPTYLLVMYLPPVGYYGSVPLSLAYYHELVALDLADWGLVLAVALPAFALCKLTDVRDSVAPGPSRARNAAE